MIRRLDQQEREPGPGDEQQRDEDDLGVRGHARSRTTSGQVTSARPTQALRQLTTM
jgi:hypothetical protein